MCSSLYHSRCHQRKRCYTSDEINCFIHVCRKEHSHETPVEGEMNLKARITPTAGIARDMSEVSEIIRWAKRCRCESCVPANGYNFDGIKSDIRYHLTELFPSVHFSCPFCSCRWRLRAYFPMWNRFSDVFLTSPRSLNNKSWIPLHISGKKTLKQQKNVERASTKKGWKLQSICRNIRNSTLKLHWLFLLKYWIRTTFFKKKFAVTAFKTIDNLQIGSKLTFLETTHRKHVWQYIRKDTSNTFKPSSNEKRTKSFLLPSAIRSGSE